MSKNHRKGIILAGGDGTRLRPLTAIISKQLLPIYDKPMIYYPLSTLMLSNIREILVISSPRDIQLFENLLGNGLQLGLKIKYAIQNEPKGIAEALIISEKFLKRSPCALILGDNIFYGNSFQNLLLTASKRRKGATVFGYRINNPKNFGVIEFNKKNMIKSIKEKPNKPKSNYIVTGLYFYDQRAVAFAKTLKPSKRGELEITDLNNLYLKNNSLHLLTLNRGFSWMDSGTPESLIEASKFVEIIEKRQGMKISCPEEIAYKKKWINKSGLKKIINKYKDSQYSKYLEKIIN